MLKVEGELLLIRHNLDDAALVDLCGSSFLKARTKIRSLDLSGNHIEGPALEQVDLCVCMKE